MYKDFLMMYQKTSKSKRKLFQKEFGIYSPHIQPHFPVQMRSVASPVAPERPSFSPCLTY